VNETNLKINSVGIKKNGCDELVSLIHENTSYLIVDASGSSIIQTQARNVLRNNGKHQVSALSVERGGTTTHVYCMRAIILLHH
jgi:hypothetical protein